MPKQLKSDRLVMPKQLKSDRLVRSVSVKLTCVFHVRAQHVHSPYVEEEFHSCEIYVVNYLLLDLGRVIHQNKLSHPKFLLIPAT